MKALANDDEPPEIPLTSLIDVVFLLLVFFLVATKFVQREVDHEIKLPSAEGGDERVGERRHLIINIRADGSLVVDGALLAADDLRGRLAGWRDENPEKRVSIRADAGVDYQAVARVLGACRAENIRDVELPVTPRDPPGGAV